MLIVRTSPAVAMVSLNVDSGHDPQTPQVARPAENDLSPRACWVLAASTKDPTMTRQSRSRGARGHALAADKEVLGNQKVIRGQVAG